MIRSAGGKLEADRSVCRCLSLRLLAHHHRLLRLFLLLLSPDGKSPHAPKEARGAVMPHDATEDIIIIVTKAHLLPILQSYSDPSQQLRAA